MFPPIHSIEDYQAARVAINAWLPAVREIGARHGIDIEQPALFPDKSTHVVVGGLGGELVLKLFAPFWQDSAVEVAVLRHVRERLPVETPTVVAEGRIEDWPYVVMTRVPGMTLGSAWERVPPDGRLRVVGQLGELMAALHALPLDGLNVLRVDWTRFVEAQVSGCASAQRARGLPPPMLDEVEPFLRSLDLSCPRQPFVLLHADLTRDQLMISDRTGRWKLCGLLDFGDSMIGPREYDFVAPAIDVTSGDPTLIRALLAGYGFAPDQLNEDLAQRLTGYLLLHRFCDVPHVLRTLGGQSVSTIPQLQSLVFPLRTIT